MKKILLSAVIIAICAANSFASHTRIYKGKYEGSSDGDHGSCTVVCSGSESFCYATTTYAIQPNQNILDMVSDVTASFDDNWEATPQSEIGNFMTIQTYDANKNVVNTFSGYYGGMSIAEDQGYKTTTILLQH